MTNEERKAALEATIYAADEPATIEQLAKALGEEKLAVQASLDELVASYAGEERGIEIRAVAGGDKRDNKPQQQDGGRGVFKRLRPPRRGAVRGRGRRAGGLARKTVESTAVLGVLLW